MSQQLPKKITTYLGQCQGICFYFGFLQSEQFVSRSVLQAQAPLRSKSIKELSHISLVFSEADVVNFLQQATAIDIVDTLYHSVLVTIIVN